MGEDEQKEEVKEEEEIMSGLTHSRTDAGDGA